MLTARARGLWEHLAGTTAGFAPAISVTASPRSYLSPPGWVSIVVMDDAVLATAPDQETAHPVEQALNGLSAARALGFRELGSQVSFRLATEVTSREPASTLSG